MFKKKKCPACGEAVKDKWQFCPQCGEELVERELEVESPFRDLWEEAERELERLDKAFGLSFEMPTFKVKPRSKVSGVSITIQSTGDEPKVEVKTFGDYRKIEPELKRRLGVKAGVEEVEEPESKVRVPKVTEEPETDVKTEGNRQTIKIKLPDVKSEHDIEVKKLEQSIEVKAFAGDKAYFTLVPVPKDSSIVKKEFKDGVLRIEVEK